MARQSDIRLRRSASQNAVPTTTQLNLGELAINTYDGKLFLKKSVGGTESIVEVGANNLADTFQIYEYSVTSSQTSFSGSDDNSNTLSYTTGSPPRVAVYLNGLLLDWGTDFTATNGTSVVLTSAAASGDLVQIQAYKSTVVAGSNLLFNDNIKAQFGNDGDLEIFHNGSNSIINEVGTGVLQFQVGGTAIYDVTTDGIVLNDGLDVEANEFIGDLRGAILFKAQAGEALSKGDVVYISGINGNTTIVSKADADDANKMPAFGVAATDITSGTTGDIFTFGTLSGLDTSAFTLGDELFVSTTAGALTSTAPTGESSKLQKIAKVTRSDNSSGSIFIMGAGRSNAVPNLDDGDIFIGNGSNQAISAALNTSIVPESGNLYFTNERVDDRVAALLTAGTGITLSYDDSAGTLQITGVAQYGDSDVESYLDANGLTLPDNVKAQFGTGNDLEIYHDGATGQSIISESGTGSLIIKGTNLFLQSADGEYMFRGNANGASSLYYDASAKLATKSDGVDITGELQADSLDIDGAADISGNLTLGGNLVVNGTTTTLNTATLTVDDLNITLADGAADKTAANGAGITIDCGSDTDATITYVSASDRFDFNNGIKSTGNLTLENTQPKIFLTDTDNNSDYQIINNNGTFTVYDGTNTASRFTINSSGNANFSGSITGSIAASNIDSGRLGDARMPTTIGASASTIFVGTLSGNASTASNTPVYATGSNATHYITFAATNGGGNSSGAGSQARLSDGHLTYNPSTNALGVSGNISAGTISTGTITGTGDIDLGDNNKILLGASDDLQIYHSGTNSIISEQGTGVLEVRTNGTEIQLTGNSGTDYMARFVSNGKTQLYYDNAGKLETTSSGIDVTGSIGVTGSIDVSDSAEIGDYKIDTTSTSTSSTAVATIHSFAAASFRSARYTIQVTNSTDSSYHTTEVLMVHDGTDANIAEYGTIFTANAEAVFDADIDSGNVRLLATPATADSMTFKVICHSITA